MPVIRVEMFSGRDQEQKRKLVQGFTDVFVNSCGGSAQSVQIIITDIEKSNWGSGGILPEAAPVDNSK